MTDKEKIDYLSRDAAFGILTRPAVELALAAMSPCSASLYILDLADIHRKNVCYGYLVVNDKIRAALQRTQEYRPELILGRIFSGDEIAIFDPAGGNDLTLIKEIIFYFRNYEIGFRFSLNPIQLGFLQFDHW